LADAPEKATEKKEPWLGYLALTTVILAVCATLSTFKGGSYSTKSVISQSQASDEWAYYQAKSIKQYQCQMQADKLQLELDAMADEQKARIDTLYRKKVDEYRQSVTRYESEKADITKQAKGLEAARDEAQKHSYAFGLAVIFLQIAILLCSISALMKRKILWIVGSVIGAIGLVYFANGFFLFM